MTTIYFQNPDRIRFESENHFFYFNNFQLKEEFRDTKAVLDLVNDLDNYFEFKVVEIMSIKDDSRPIKYYTFNGSTDLPADKEIMTLTKLLIKTKINTDIRPNIYYENIIGDYGVRQKQIYQVELSQAKTKAEINEVERKQNNAVNNEIKRILNRYFINASNSNIQSVEVYSQSIMEQKKYRKKRNIGNQWGLSHQDAYGSNIEQILGEAMKAQNMHFIQQQEIFNEGILMTVLDFYIEEAKLAIYCDGFKYHYDKDSVIKDRTQDRLLQLKGYRVLRYTGSEIVGNVHKCVNEINQFIKMYRNI